ncbi:MAG TPA: MFS transporter, partial [Caulobacteraceae bacterium]|nr:MFS transporter [Caulobacteraceae bacterium]
MDLVFVAGLVITLITAIPVLAQLRTHPRGLFVLFFAEMWERFSFYGMRGLLIFYLTQHFLFDDKRAQGQYGAYASLVYLMPLIGGLLADRILGARKAIAVGALLLVAGHFTMAAEGPPATQVLSYDNAAYEFQVTGRGDARQVKLVVDGKAYDYGPSADGGLEIKNLPPNAPLPSVLAKDTYTLDVKGRSAIFTNILYLALSLIIV